LSYHGSYIFNGTSVVPEQDLP